MNDAKTNLRALFEEYFILDERVSEDKLLDLAIDAVTKPIKEQPLIVQSRIKGTRANKLYRTPSDRLSATDQELLDYRRFSDTRP